MTASEHEQIIRRAIPSLPLQRRRSRLGEPPSSSNSSLSTAPQRSAGSCTAGRHPPSETLCSGSPTTHLTGSPTQ